jgi:hypothetical protein
MLTRTVLKACNVQGMQGSRRCHQKLAFSAERMRSPADSERLSDSQRRLSIIRETPDKATLERSSPAEGRVKGGGAALNSLSQKENASGNSSFRKKIQNGVLKAK